MLCLPALVSSNAIQSQIAQTYTQYPAQLLECRDSWAPPTARSSLSMSPHDAFPRPVIMTAALFVYFDFTSG